MNADRIADAIAAAVKPLLAEGLPPEEIAVTLISFGTGFALRLWDRSAVARAQAITLEEHARGR